MKICLTQNDSKPAFKFVPPRAVLYFHIFILLRHTRQCPTHKHMQSPHKSSGSHTQMQRGKVSHSVIPRKIQRDFTDYKRDLGKNRFLGFFTAGFSTCQISQMLQHYVQCASASSRNNRLLLGLFNNCWLKAAFRNTGRFIKQVQVVP